MDTEELLQKAERAFEKGEWLQSIAASNLVLAKQNLEPVVVQCGAEREWMLGEGWPCVLPEGHFSEHKDKADDEWI